MPQQQRSNRLGKKRWKTVCLLLGTRVLLFLIGISVIPYIICSRSGDDWYRGDIGLQTSLARGVEKWVTQDISRSNFSTGSKLFDGEWLFGTFMMAGMGFGQTALEHPELREQHVALMEECIEQILSERVKAFDRERWQDDPIESLDSGSDHAAYLGYLNLMMSLHRLLKPESEYSELNDRITEALVRRVNESRTLLLQSYPYEVYPVDNCYVIASIALHAKATGIDRSALINKWVETCRARYIDPESGLLYQCVDARSGAPVDRARGSGTVLGLYALSFADMPLSRELFDAAKKTLAKTSFGFAGVREYPSGTGREHGDIDSGPIVAGYGLSATGFMIAGCRIHGDADYYRRLYATAHACGVPTRSDDRRTFLTGGSLGNAILFAMLTARASE